MRFYQRFLNAVLRSEDLKTFPFLVTFLKSTDQKQFTKDLQKLKEAKVGRSLKDLVTASGEAKV